MQSWREQLTRFQDMKWSEIIEGRKQDILRWVTGSPAATPSAPNTVHFSFNTALLRPHFQNLSLDSKTLPFIEFSAIGLLKAPADMTKTEDLLPIIQKLRNREAPYHNFQNDLRDTPLIIAVGRRYYLYGNTDGSIWTLTELDSTLMDSCHLHFTNIPFYLEYDLQHYPIYHHIIEKNGHTHFSTQPQQIAKIKQIINSTFYIQALLREAEGIQFNMSGFFGIGSAFVNYINGATYDNIYRAITLLANSEIDFAHRFQDEVGEFLQMLDRFKQMSTTMTQVATPPAPGVYNPANSFQVGHAAGFVTRYIYDANGQWDIDVFSQFSADLPKHIDLLTTLINANNSTVTQYAPNINAAQLRALQKEATQLLNTLKNTQNNAKRSKFNPLYQMYQIINYAFLLRQIIALLSTTLNQVGQLNEAYQESFRDILSILQMEFFPLLVIYAAHAEVELVLEAGTLSGPVVNTITYCNHYLADRIRSLANFAILGEELLTIEHSGFLNKCEAAIQSMFHDCQQAQQEIQWAQEAMTLFFENLNAGDRATLRTHYAWLAPYVQNMNPVLNRSISLALTATQGVCELSNETVQLLRCQLTAYLTKLKNTQALRAQQCQAVLAGLPKSINIQLLPYSKRIGCAIALKIAIEVPLNSLNLPMDHPILIQHRMKSETTYVFYGNTDGTKWDFTPIAVAFIHPGILRHFDSLRRNSTTTTQQNVLHILSYRIKYHSLYQQMIFRKAHTHYYSQLSSLESEALAKQDSLTTLVCKPIEWVCNKWQNQAARVENSANQAVNEPPLTITRVNEDQDYFDNLQELSIKQVLTLYRWYQKKIANYHQAEENLGRFQTLINDHFQGRDIQFAEKSPLLLECQYLYHALRPYLIGIRNFPDFDQQIVKALSVSTPSGNQGIALSCSAVNRNLASFPHDLAQQFIVNWQQRAEQLLLCAQQALRSQNEQALTQRRGSFTTQPRDEFLLKSTEISTKIKEFNDSIQKWVPILNPRIQQELKLKKANGTARYPHISDLNEQLHHYSDLQRQLLLRNRPVEAPYLDINELKDQLRQPPYVLFFKRIFNAVHHLEHLAVKLEEIRTGNTSEIKNATTELIINIGREHGQALINIGLQLRDDRVFSEFCQDAYQQFSDIVQKILNLAKPYTPDVQKVHPKTEGVTFPGLWYSMNAFYTLPAHLLSITNQKHPNLGYGMRLINDTNEDVATPSIKTLTLIQHRSHYYIYSNGTGNNWQLRTLPYSLIASLAIDFRQNYLNYAHQCQPLYDYLIQKDYHFTKLNELQISAKRATQNIERIIRDSNHYFRLFFFDGSMIYQLNQRLQTQLTFFTSTTQEVVLSHLGILQTDYFAPLLVKADTKEQEWGLLAGTLTEPLEAIRTELYQGLIFPLKMTFKEKVDFCTSDVILLTRIDAEQQRLDALSADNAEQNTEIDTVAAFTNDLKDFVSTALTITGIYQRTPPSISLVNSYSTNIYPKLLKYCNTFIPEWIANIPTNLSRDNLPAIKTQIAAYHTRLARLSLLHNIHDRKMCKELPAFIARLDAVLLTDASTAIPADLSEKYLSLIVPELQNHRQSFIPDWLKKIDLALNRNTMSAILEQTETYSAYLAGLVATRLLYKQLSTEKLAYLQEKHTQHLATSLTDYRQAFAKHYFHTYVNRLSYKASGLVHTQIHREYHRELKAYLTQQEAAFLAPLTNADEVDTVLNQTLQEEITEFNQRYFERFHRLDRLQTAINTFKDYIAKEPHFPRNMRKNKMNCLNDLEKIIYEKRGESGMEMEAFFNHRSQLLQESIETNKKLLLETHPQFSTMLDWLIDCVFSLLVALGLATPTSQIHYAELENADNPHPNLPSNWLSFVTFRAAPGTPPRGGAQIVTEQTPARNSGLRV